MFRPFVVRFALAAVLAGDRRRRRGPDTVTRAGTGARSRACDRTRSADRAADPRRAHRHARPAAQDPRPPARDREGSRDGGPGGGARCGGRRQRLRAALGGQCLPPPHPRLSAGRQPLLRRRRRQPRYRHVPAAARPPERRGDAVQDLRFPDHDRLRRRHRGGAGRVCRRALRQGLQRARRQAEAAARPGAAAVGDRHPVHRAGAADRAGAEPRRRRPGLRRSRLVADVPGRGSSTASSTAAAATSTPPTARTSSAGCSSRRSRAASTIACSRCPSASAAAPARKPARSPHPRSPSCAAADSWCGSAIAPTARRPIPPSPMAAAPGSRRTGSTYVGQLGLQAEYVRVATGGPARHHRRRDRAAVLAADRFVGADRRGRDRPRHRPPQAVRARQGRRGVRSKSSPGPTR